MHCDAHQNGVSSSWAILSSPSALANCNPETPPDATVRCFKLLCFQNLYVRLWWFYIVITDVLLRSLIRTTMSLAYVACYPAVCERFTSAAVASSASETLEAHMSCTACLCDKFAHDRWRRRELLPHLQYVVQCAWMYSL